MEDDIAVYSERIKVPLFNAYYDIAVGTDMPTLKEHSESEYPGLKLSDSVGHHTPGYTYLLHSNEFGSKLTVLISLQELDIPDGPSLESTIVHEAVHVSWYIMDGVGIKVDQDNHEIQCYLIEHIVREITRVVAIAQDSIADNPLDDL